MLAEASTIDTTGQEVSMEQSLGIGLDENKLLQEATQMDGAPGEDKKLMDDFEDFMKKGGKS